MRNFLLSLVAILAVTVSVQAQDPVKALKKAKQSFGAYKVDPGSNTDKLKEAMELIEIAAQSDATNGLYKTWKIRGDIYNSSVSKEAGLVAAGAQTGFSEEAVDHLYKAVESYKKALSLAEKKYEKRDAANGLSEAASYLNILGNSYLTSQQYAKAYKPLRLTLELDELVKQNGGQSVFADEEEYNNNLFVVAYCARVSGMEDEALALYQKLYDLKYDDANVYAAYFDLLNKKGDEEKALKVLEEGKAKFPGNTELLFAEINYYLRQGRMEELIGKLEMAIQQEPDNVSLYTTLGSVYDNLFQKETQQEGEYDKDKAEELFQKALSYYQQALEKDPQSFDANYSVGALYYNKAVVVIKEMQALEDDYSREGLRKYDEKQKELIGLFKEALPWFQKAEALNPNDQNTLIALKEIYARLDDLEMSAVFKERLERVMNGEELDEAYFKQ